MAKLATSLLSLTTAALALSQPVCGQELPGKKPEPDLIRQHAFAIELSPGPLVTYEKNGPGRPHVVSIYAANCDGTTEAKLFWRNSGNADVVARLDQHHILIASYGEPYGLMVADTKNGRHHLLAAGSPHDFVAVRGDEVLYVGDNRWDKGDNHLYTKSWRGPGKARKLAEPRFDSIPIIQGNLAIGITYEEREVWSISLTRGKGRKLYELPEGAAQTQVSLSPSGQRLAIGTNIQWRGHLAVVDVASGKVLNKWDGLNIGVSPLSSFMPTVRVNWFDDEEVVTSETIARGRLDGDFAFVRRNVATGKVTEELTYGAMSLRHSEPPRGGRKPAAPQFEIAAEGDRYLLLERGRKEPLQTVPKDHRHGARIQLSRDGRFAVVHLERDPNKCLLYRAGQPPLTVCEDGATDWQWLPASRAVESRSK